MNFKAGIYELLIELLLVSPHYGGAVGSARRNREVVIVVDPSVI